MQCRRLEVDLLPAQVDHLGGAAYAGLKRSERIAAAVAIAFDHLDDLFEFICAKRSRVGTAAFVGRAVSNGAQLFVFQWLA